MLLNLEVKIPEKKKEAAKTSHTSPVGSDISKSIKKNNLKHNMKFI